MTQVDAQFRKSILSDITYNVQLALLKGPTYMGQTTIKFNLAKVPEKELYVDFEGKMVNNILINGKSSAQKSYDGFRILLDNNLLKVKQNEVQISFLNDYRNDGDGLHSFVDQSDG